LNPGKSPVKEHLLSVNALDIRLCSVVKAELYYGAMKSNRSGDNLVLLEEFFANFAGVEYTVHVITTELSGITELQ